MKKIFNYLYYRYAGFYKNWGDGSPYLGGYLLLFIAIQSYLLTLINILSFVCRIQIPNNFVVYFTIPMLILVVIFTFVFDSKKKYEDLHELFKDEKNKKRNMIFAWFFFAFAILLYVLTLIYVRVNGCPIG